MKKIMVCYDDSRPSKDGLKLSKEYAKAFEAKIYIVTSMVKGTEKDRLKIKNFEEEHEQINIDFSNEGIPCETHLLIRGFEPGEDIVKFADTNGIDEIIMGVHRRSKVGKFIFGSVSQYVILRAHCPVVTVK